MPKLEACVFQNSKGQNLVGIMHHAAGSGLRPAVVVAHGFAGNKLGGSRRFVEFARYAAEQGLSVFRFDFAGSGDSDGDLIDLTLDQEMDDLRAAIDAVLAMEGVDPERVGLVGHCMGATTVIRGAARDERICKTVAWAPFTDLDDTMTRLLGEDVVCFLRDGEESDFLYNEQLFTAGPAILESARDVNMYDEVARVKSPLLVIHGTEDSTVPLAEVEKLMEHAKNTPGDKHLMILEGAHHSFPYHKEELFEMTLDFFRAEIAVSK